MFIRVHLWLKIDLMHVAPQFQPIFRELGIDADAVFDHPQIRAWRTLDDRENCTLGRDACGRSIDSLACEAYPAMRGSPADDEVRGLRLLEAAGIPTMTLVAWGGLSDGRSFVITEDLAGYQPADKLLENGFAFDRIREPLADLAAKLHNAGLHHRDLYLCHFFVKAEDATIDVRLIDIARVKKLPVLLTRQRWIVKDLAQFWYSTMSVPIPEPQRQAWLVRYAQERGEARRHPTEAGDREKGIADRQARREIAKEAAGEEYFDSGDGRIG